MNLARVVVLAAAVLGFAACGGSDSSSPSSHSQADSARQRSQVGAYSSGAVDPSTVSLTNGAPVNTESFPYVKQLRLTFDSGASFSFGACTATFISSHVLLTAAHCLYDLRTMQPLAPENVEVEIEPGHFISSVGVLPHPEFTGQFNYSLVYADTVVAAADIGVVFSAEEYTGPVPTLGTVPPAVGDTLALLGYGQSDASNIYTGGTLRLGFTTADAVSPLERLLYWVQDSPAEASTCHGDSGGPAFLVNGRNELVLVGVTSSGDPDCRPHFAAVDTLATSFVDWISAAAGGDVQLQATN